MDLLGPLYKPLYGPEWSFVKFVVLNGPSDTSWSFMFLHVPSCSFMVLHIPSWSFMVLHGPSWSFMVLHSRSFMVPCLSFMVHHGPSWSFMVPCRSFVVPYGCCRWLQVVTRGWRWLLVVVSGCKWSQVIAGGCKWLSVVAGGCKWLEVLFCVSDYKWLQVVCNMLQFVSSGLKFWYVWVYRNFLCIYWFLFNL
jgi:hypothetical protein